MDDKLVMIGAERGIPVIAFTGNCTPDSLDDLASVLEKIAQTGKKGFVFDFSACKLICSPALGELLEAILLLDQSYDAHIIASGLDSLKTTLFTVTGIIPVIQTSKTVEEALTMLESL